MFNIIFKLDAEDDDVTVISFATRYEAKIFYDECKKHLPKKVLEEGKEYQGDMICYTESGPYLYVRLQGCYIHINASYRIKEYLNA